MLKIAVEQIFAGNLLQVIKTGVIPPLDNKINPKSNKADVLMLPAPKKR